MAKQPWTIAIMKNSHFMKQNGVGLKIESKMYLKKKLSSLFARWLPLRILQILESISQVGLGKGWDGGINNEIQLILREAHKLGIVGIVALDVGANQGLWTSTLKALDPIAEVHVFEPSSSSFKLLKLNLETLKGVFAYQLALGNSIKKTILYSNFESSPLASLSKRKLMHQDIQFSNVEEIDLVTLDSWAAEHPSVIPNVIKIDVEGHELEVLEGARSLLSQARIIQFEFGGTDIDSRVFFQDFWYFFTSTPFKIFRATPKGLLEIKKYSESEETFKFMTYYAINLNIPGSTV